MRSFHSLSVRLTVQSVLLFAATMLTVGATLLSVILVSDSQEVVRFASRQAEILAALTMLGLLATAIITWRAAGRIIRPLVRLDEAAGRLASGQPVQVRVRGSDELAR